VIPKLPEPIIPTLFIIKTNNKLVDDLLFIAVDLLTCLF